MTKLDKPNSFRKGPDERGRFGIYGGRFVAETLMPLILSLEKAYEAAKADPTFQAELDRFLKHYAGRPSPLYFAERLTEQARRRENLFQARRAQPHRRAQDQQLLGQILLARRMGKKRIIAETGAGQHGVATATVCARFGLPCVVYMGAIDIERQKPNVFRMKTARRRGAPGQAGARTLKDAMNEALRDWVTNVDDTFYLHRHRRRPASLSDDGARLPIRDRRRDAGANAWSSRAGLPDAWSRRSAAARTPSASSIPSSTTRESRCSASRPAATASTCQNGHAASITGGRPGVLHGNRTYLLQDDDGQILEGHSISAGLDYPGVGPEHSWLHDIGRVTYLSGDRHGGARSLPALLAGSRASSRRSNRRMRSPR